MKILIFTDTSKLDGNAKKELCHLDGDVYIQYIDPRVNKPEDISLVKWDVIIIYDSIPLSKDWNRVLGKYSRRGGISNIVHINKL